ncbi:MAG: O-antigen ligase family protein [Candidatus Komeilibacteria bacterium]
MPTKILTYINRLAWPSILLVEVASFWHFYQPSFAPYLWWLIIGLTFILSWRKLEYGLYIMWLELIIGSHGHALLWTINGFDLSIRMGIFIVILILGWWHFWQQRSWQSWQNRQPLIWYVWAIIFLLAVVVGLMKFGWQGSWFDWNGYLYWLLVPIFTLTYSREFILNLWRLLLTGVNWLAIKTFLLLAVFAHQISWLDISLLYRWMRDLRLGEITYVSQNYYRIFMPSQIFAVVVWLGIVLLWLNKDQLKYKFIDNWYIWLSAFAAVSVLLVSWSRSYWLATIIMTIVLIVYYAYQQKSFFLLYKVSARVISISILAILLMFFWTGSFNSGQAMAQRVTNLSEPAASTRIAQLGPLWQQIRQSPWLGNGFGQTVTYQSDDPRIRTSANPDGWYTTAAFEWGYLDIWLKMGFWGLVFYLAIILLILYNKLKNSQNTGLRTLVSKGLAWGLLAVLIINIFSPYLNHPLGIGLILINWYQDV